MWMECIKKFFFHVDTDNEVVDSKAVDNKALEEDKEQLPPPRPPDSNSNVINNNISLFPFFLLSGAVLPRKLMRPMIRFATSWFQRRGRRREAKSSNQHCR